MTTDDRSRVAAPATPVVADERGDRVAEPEQQDGRRKTKKGHGKKRAKKKSKTPSPSARSTSRSLFRNSYRTQLGLTQLADNKASIMISVNGFILTIFMASGGFILGSEPRLLVPFSVLLVACLVSMSYAVLAARPRRSGPNGRPRADGSRRTNLLFFEHFGRMKEEDYARAIVELVQDADRTDEEMARHLFGLGRVLIRKFRFLRISYTVFIVGLAVSIASFLGVAAVVTENGISDLGEDGTTRFASVYEPSGAVQLSDGRVLVVEDELAHAFTVLELDEHGGLSAAGVELEADVDLDDLEGLAADSRGWVYAITSHSTTEKGTSQPERERLVRFVVEDLRAGDVQTIHGLSEMIANEISALDPMGDRSAKAIRRRLNVEGLGLDVDGERLLIGLRAPLVEGRAVVVPLGNMDAAFDGLEAPRLDPLILLDLGGEGVRGLAYAPKLAGILILGGPPGRPTSEFGLWLWSGEPGDAPRRLEVRGGKRLERAEGVTPVRWGATERLLIVNDDGKRGKKRRGSYQFLDYHLLD